MIRKRMLLAIAVVLVIGLFSTFGYAAPPKDPAVKVVIAQEPLTLDPTQFSSGNDRLVIDNWGEWLLNRDPDGKVVPGLATAWKVSPDGKKIEFVLRKGVKFHSGDLMTAKDVLFSWERAKEKSRDVKSGMVRVEKIEIVDDYRITVHFKQPDVVFILNLAWCPVVSKAYFDRVGENTFTTKPSGAGPYKVVEYRSGEYVDIERFEEYYGKKPQIKKARIYFVGEDSTRLAKLKAGEVDLIQNVPFTDIKELGQSPNFRLVKWATLHPTRSILFGLNNSKVPWYKKEVRQAMALAINGEAIVSQILYGVPIRLGGLAPHELGYDPAVKPYPYDPKKAKALLAQAGYPNGFEMTFYWQSGGRNPMTKEIVEAIAAYWESVGIRTKLVGEDTAATLSRRSASVKPDAVYVGFYTAGFAGGVDPTQPLNSYFNSEGRSPVYTTPELSKVIQEALTTMDVKKRAELIKKAVKYVHEDVGIIPVHNTVVVWAMKKNINYNPTLKVNFDFLYVKNMSVN
ncbi:MAG: ABC transporter substrate-binding protein [Deltaproteobacteria bacterium]|nr:ABC transporter substrate-binding protein [Deltaproteobacteria bacterium]